LSQIKILCIAGSLGSGSYNRALLRAAEKLAPREMTFHTFDLIPIPLYNADVETQGDPPSVSAFKEAIQEADGLLIATPEYNYSVPGVLKNAIDWASRPPNPLSKKPAGIIGATPGIGGTIRAQQILRQSFVYTETYAMLKPELLVASCRDKFDAQGNLTDERTRRHLTEFLAALYKWVLLLKQQS
jgi:chromate reductase, NAD(P)H dehydrogenase (quinone)